MNKPTAFRRLERLRDRTTARAGRGQSLVEFALVLPLILLVVVIALDFGRVYLGYINLQNMARIAANFAANNPDAAWGNAADPDVIDYRRQILNDATATNCRLPVVGSAAVIPDPAFVDHTGNGATKDVGDTATVSLTCSFRILTPIISGIVGTNGDLAVSASAEFPVKTGLIGTGGTTATAPSASFFGNPLSGPSPLVVAFTDQSTGGPSSWAWDFESDGTIDSTAEDPTFTYSNPGQYTVTLVVSNSEGSDTLTRTNYVTVGAPLAVVSFTANPSSGPRPLTVVFTDTSTNTPTAWAWDFNNDGTTDSTVQNPTFTYNNVGLYSVRLTVTNAGGSSSTLVSDLITVTIGTCTVPNFAGVLSSNAQALWAGANFTTNVNFQQGNLPWVIQSQNQVVGQQIPCNSPITVSKN
jgi:PKD repeat protein